MELETLHQNKPDSERLHVFSYMQNLDLKFCVYIFIYVYV